MKIEWKGLDGKPLANPDFSGYRVGTYCIGVPATGWVLYSTGAGCWEQRTQPELPPFKGAFPLRMLSGWQWVGGSGS